MLGPLALICSPAGALDPPSEVRGGRPLAHNRGLAHDRETLARGGWIPSAMDFHGERNVWERENAMDEVRLANYRGRSWPSETARRGTARSRSR